MLYARRTLRGVLLFALALFFTTALKAQSVFRWTESGPVARKALAPDADFRAPVAALPSFDAFALINLEAKNKRGRSILAARQRVLEILSSANACSEWFAQLGSDPLHTFRTLTFALDQKAEEHVIERTNAGKLEVRASPYVAKVAQDGGESQTVTLNAGGAFFQSVSNVIRLAKEGGPAQNHGSRPLRVGPYLGNTLEAQLTTLLHELGHVLGLLPFDGLDANGQSAVNTTEVLRHCRSSIEGAARQRASAP